MAKAGGSGGGSSGISETIDGITTDAYAVLFTDAIPGRMLGIGTIKNVAAIAASGDGIFPDPGGLPTGTTFTLDDGTNPATTFEFVRGGMPAPGNVGIDIAGFTTKNQVRNQVVIEINGAGALAITASPGSTDGTIDLVNDSTGSAGNVPIIYGPPLTFSGMSGGTDGGNSMTVRETVIDAFGVTDATTETVVPSGDDYLLDLQTNFGAARPPYVSYSVAVKATTPGSQTAFELRSVAQGED